MATTSEHRDFNRYELGCFVNREARAGVPEGYLAVDISRGGMSLLRLANSSQDSSSTLEVGGDPSFEWMAIPLPEQGLHLCALVEIVHQKTCGPLESIGVKFRYLSPANQEILDDFLVMRAQYASVN